MIPKNATNRPKLVLKRSPTNKIRVLNVKMLQKDLAIFLSFELDDLKKTIRYCRKSVKESGLAARKKVVKSFELVLVKELDIYRNIQELIKTITITAKIKNEIGKMVP